MGQETTYGFLPKGKSGTIHRGQKRETVAASKKKGLTLRGKRRKESAPSTSSWGGRRKGEQAFTPKREKTAVLKKRRDLHVADKDVHRHTGEKKISANSVVKSQLAFWGKENMREGPSAIGIQTARGGRKQLLGRGAPRRKAAW